ncbi:glycosyltransferase [candidate division WWE3 bacterium]|uniref:Glycosyltransferase n=1 Tax=candidate division WWE3 bacterium TaxID=2053526 RepID=A0A955EDM3_UNCKA|nr:glycosyltransferase [candidate division WWE3 bacterium]
MKVLFQGRVDLNVLGGGDKIQIENTASELRKLGVDVDISTSLTTDYSPYDLIHVFQLDWTPESYLYAKKSKKYNKPLVLSPIHHSIKEVELFDKRSTYGIYRKISGKLLWKQSQRDTLKNLFKSIYFFPKIYPTLVSVFMGLHNMQRTALQLADYVLVQTNIEVALLKESYGVEFKWEKVQNGVASHFLNFKAPNSDLHPTLKIKDYLLCVGRVEARKNQLAIIEAVENLRKSTNIDFNLVFVGVLSEQKHQTYVRCFLRLVEQHSWITYLGQVPYVDIPEYIHYASVGVSASWFESTGLTSLDAVICGANAVATGEQAREYLGDLAYYCNPADVSSISAAILKAYNAPKPQIQKELISSYTWENAANQTLEVYKKLLG